MWPSTGSGATVGEVLGAGVVVAVGAGVGVASGSSSETAHPGPTHAHDRDRRRRAGRPGRHRSRGPRGGPTTRRRAAIPRPTGRRCSRHVPHRARRPGTSLAGGPAPSRRHRRASRARARTTVAGARRTRPAPRRTRSAVVAHQRRPDREHPIAGRAERRDAAPSSRPQVEAPEVVEPFVLGPVEPRFPLADDGHHGARGVKTGENTATAPAGAATVRSNRPKATRSAGSSPATRRASRRATMPGGSPRPAGSSGRPGRGVWMTTVSGPARRARTRCPSPPSSSRGGGPLPPGRERPPVPVPVEHDERPAADHRREAGAARGGRVPPSFDACSAAHAAARGAWPNAVPETMPMMLAVRPTASEIVR